MEKIRTFVAISLTSILINRLEQLISEMRPLSRGVKWVKPRAIHLTLKFLGNLAPDELERVFAGMKHAQNKYPESFTIQVQGTGSFPSARKPRVLWVGLSGADIPKLHSMQELTELELSRQGFPMEERLFKPHLTVARIKENRDLNAMLDKFMQYDFPAVDLPVEEIHVMRSELRPEGAIYSRQKTYKLKEVS
jgi:2'-5' RNA ligase